MVPTWTRPWLPGPPGLFDTPGSAAHGQRPWPCGTTVIMRKGQFERIKPLNWPLALCPREDSNLRHPLQGFDQRDQRGFRSFECLEGMAVKGRS
jgi:hypothetical protein